MIWSLDSHTSTMPLLTVVNWGSDETSLPVFPVEGTATATEGDANAEIGAKTIVVIAVGLGIGFNP